MSPRQEEITRRTFVRRCSDLAGLAMAGLAGPTALAGSSRPAARGPRTKVRVGQIGTSHAHARGKMETLRKLAGEYEVVGIVEPDQARRKTTENHRAYKGLKWMTEEQLLNTKGLEAIAVETEERDLVPTGLRCIEAGMHIHLDKPPGESLSAFRELLEQATRRGLAVQLGYMFRSNPAFKFCFQAVREGWLGSVFEVHGVISKTIGAAAREKLAGYDGGSMFILGCHLIDALVAVLGTPDRVSAYPRRTRPRQDELTDNHLAVFEYPRATATIRSALVEVEGFKRRQFVVCGDKGTIDIRPLEPPRLRLALAKPCGRYTKGYQDVALPAMPGRYDNQLVDFARIIRGEKQTEYPPSHDLAVHEAVLRAGGMPIS